MPPSSRLLNGAGDVGKHRVAVRADQADGADHDDEDRRDQDCVFGNILTILIEEQAAKRTSHGGRLLLLTGRFSGTQLMSHTEHTHFKIKNVIHCTALSLPLCAMPRQVAIR
jgi:hypothetical protein